MKPNVRKLSLGICLVVPALLSWTGSVVIHDIKGESGNLTSGAIQIRDLVSPDVPDNLLEFVQRVGV